MPRRHGHAHFMFDYGEASRVITPPRVSLYVTLAAAAAAADDAIYADVSHEPLPRRGHEIEPPTAVYAHCATPRHTRCHACLPLTL